MSQRPPRAPCSNRPWTRPWRDRSGSGVGQGWGGVLGCALPGRDRSGSGGKAGEGWVLGIARARGARMGRGYG
eukprot:scaffold3082_cov119-Isochrysis_galbana.AAC.1